MITYCFDINVKICNVLICLELIKMLPKSIHQIAPFSFQNSKIFQLLRGAHPPSDTPLCAQARNWRWRATRSSPQCSKRRGTQRKARDIVIHNNTCSSELARMCGMSYISQLGSVKNTHLAARNLILPRILTARTHNQKRYQLA